jgi:hypothetical protein
MVVMSKGTKWTQQSYKVDSSFPYEWIKKKWREQFHVTAMATAGKPGEKQQWAIVMSRDTEFGQQFVEIDFQYPSEGIHYYWNKGAHLSAMSSFHLSVNPRITGAATRGAAIADPQGNLSCPSQREDACECMACQ